MTDQFAEQLSQRAPRDERRQTETREELVRRLATAFHEVSGLTMTWAQAARLFHLEPPQSDRVLAELVARGVLKLSPEGSLMRGTPLSDLRDGIRYTANERGPNCAGTEAPRATESQYSQ
jgi:hypothetical protein